MADLDYNQWLDLADRARAVPIEKEIGRRGVTLQRQGKTGFVGPCPKCGGEDRFAINTKKQLFHCRGCDVGGDVIALVEHLDGVDFKTACATLIGLPSTPTRKSNSKHPDTSKRIIVATFDYHDQNGHLLFGVDRIEFQKPDGTFVLKDGKRAKTFRQKRPDPDHRTRWINNVEGVSVVPYRLPELINAVTNGQMVVVAEGEAKVDLLRAWNVSATCCAGGAGNWTEEHAKFLRDAAVVILPDNDDRGHQYADRVGSSLHGIAKSVRVLGLPGLPPKGDIIDWAKAGGTREQLDALLATAPDWKLVPVSDASSKSGAKPSGKQLVVYDASAVTPEPVEWLWSGRIAIGKTTLIGGDPGLGKSQLSIFIASTISQAGEWPCGEGKSPERSVIMLSAEDGVADTIVPRLMAAGADLTKIKIVTAVHEEDGTGRRIFNLTQDLDALETLITKLGDVGLVTIDPVDAYIGTDVDSHKNSAVRAVLEPISEMADRLNVAIVALTHFSKQTANRAIYRFIGSIAQIGAARIAFAIVADPDDKTRVLLLHAKNNLAPPQKGLAFRIQQHVVTDDGVIGSSVFFEPKHVTDVSADDVLAAEADAGQATVKDEVKEFLLTVLANGRVKIQDIEAEARSADLLGEDKQMRQAKPFRSAKDDLHIVSTHEGFGRDAIYYWSLPEHAPATADATMRAPDATMCAHDKNRAHMENEGAHGDWGVVRAHMVPSMRALRHHARPLIIRAHMRTRTPPRAHIRAMAATV